MRAITAVTLGLVVLLPHTTGAWGMDVHRFITRRVVENLPADLRPFYVAKIDFISEHAADPDLWRIVGLKGPLGEEDPNHYLDLDALDEPAPFKNVPRDWDAFVGKYGLDRANKTGRLPWRTEEIFNKLVTTFQDIGKGTAPYAPDNSRYLIAVLSHYLEDAHVPFHATANHDGQLTGQRGIHSRFESDLVLRNLSKITIATPVKLKPIPNIRDFVFDTLVDSQALVAPLLDADRKSVVGHEKYDDAYYASFAPGSLSIAERRINDAVSAVVSAVVIAWEKGGKPKLPVTSSATPAPIH